MLTEQDGDSILRWLIIFQNILSCIGRRSRHPGQPGVVITGWHGQDVCGYAYVR
jgi:hypothetical protein